MPAPSTNEEFLIRSRELRAAQRMGLAPQIPSQAHLAKALGMSVHTVRKCEMTAVLKVSDGLQRRGLTLSVIRALLAPKHEI